MGQPTPPADPATPPAEPTTTEPPKAEPATGKADDIARMQEALTKANDEAKRFRLELKELRERDPLKELLSKLGQPQEPDTDPAQALQDRIAAMERKTAEAEERALRAEVAQAKGLTAKQAARLRGSTREELEADADDLVESFKAAGSPSGTPAPDPTQGARGGANDLDARIAAAEAKGKAGVRDLIRLKEEKAAQARQ